MLKQKKLVSIIITNYAFIAMIGLMVLYRALSIELQNCPKFFDCNIYIHLLHQLDYIEGGPSETLRPHGMVRFLPSLIARLFYGIGFSIETSFRIISICSHIIFATGVYCFLNRFLKDRVMALILSLILCSIHHAFKASLQMPYLANDALCFVFSLALINFTINKKSHLVFILGLVGVAIRQNLFFLTFISLIYLLLKTKQKVHIVYMGLIAAFFMGLMVHYQAFSISVMHVNPLGFGAQSAVNGIFSSGLYEFFLPLLPFLFIINKKVFLEKSREYWFIIVYSLVIIAQPIIAYDITGNNFHRIALHGIWPLYLPFFLSLAHISENQKNKLKLTLLPYSLIIFYVWRPDNRLILGIFTVFSIIILNNIWRHLKLAQNHSH